MEVSISGMEGKDGGQSERRETAEAALK